MVEIEAGSGDGSLRALEAIFRGGVYFLEHLRVREERAIVPSLREDLVRRADNVHVGASVELAAISPTVGGASLGSSAGVSGSGDGLAALHA